MKKRRVKQLMVLMMAGLMLFQTPVAAMAAENEEDQNAIIMAEDTDLSAFSMPDFSSEAVTENHEVDLNAPTELEIDKTKANIDLSARKNQRSGFTMSDNPNAGVEGQLTAANTMDFYFFNITESDKFLLAMLLSGNANYVAQVYMLDEAGNASPTNVYGFAGELIQLNGLPVGEYAMAIFSNDGTVGNSYTFQINAMNPAANLKKVTYLANDLSIFMYETLNGDVFGNGKEIYNTGTKTGPNLSWKRYEYLGIGSGYEQRTHEVYNVKVKAMSKPATYKAAAASSDCVVLLYCDVDTGFTYYHSMYQATPEGATHFDSFIDTTGQKTPRGLNSNDFYNGSEHILAFDLNTGKPIDFYSYLNLYYGGGYEAQPVINFYD